MNYADMCRPYFLHLYSSTALKCDLFLTVDGVVEDIICIRAYDAIWA